MGILGALIGQIEPTLAVGSQLDNGMEYRRLLRIARISILNSMTRVLITGCSTGIGRATALLLSEQGYDVVATARDLSTIEDLGVAARIQLDVTDDASVRAAAGEAGEIDVLVNNAGFSVWGPIETVPLTDVADLFDTNVFGVVRTIQAFVPGMRERRHGKVVNVSSAAGRGGGSPFLGWYATTKHAVEVLTEALRYEVGHLGVDVALVEPGAIDTSFAQNRRTAGMGESDYAAMFTTFLDFIASTRATAYPAEDVATVIADVIADQNPRLRWYGSPDAEVIVSSRVEVPDEEIEEAIRRRFGFELRRSPGEAETPCQLGRERAE